MEINDVFDRMKDMALYHEAAWTRVPNPMGLNLSRTKMASGLHFRVEFEIGIPYDDFCLIARPHVLFHPRRPEFDPMISECGVEEELAPGDVIARVQIQTSAPAQRVASLVSGHFRAGGINGHVAGPWRMLHRVRYTIRKNFPTPDKLSAAAAPLHPETSEMQEEVGWMQAAACYLEAIGENKTKVVGFGRVAPYMTLMLPLSMGQNMGMHEYIRLVHTTPLFEEGRSGDLSYMIIMMRRIEGGKPLLLPTIEGSEDLVEVLPGWRQMEGFERFSLAAYIRDFAARKGIDLPVFSSLDGRALMPFQAAVRRGAWGSAWELLAGAFHEQRIAFRRVHGGKNAPSLTIDVEPRFDDANRRRLILQGAQSVRLMPQQRTFLHFGSHDMLLRLRRSGSAPSLDGLVSC